MIIREKYLKKMIDAKDTEFIKIITGVRRSGKSTLLLMFRDYLLKNGVKKENIIHMNFESALFDDIKDYKDLYKGLRNIVLGFRNINEGHLLENIVYLELLRREYKVNIGKIGDYEVDFVAENPHTIKYYQVTQTLKDEKVKIRELRSLENISDNYEKIILSMDNTINNDYNSIKVKNIISWLLENEDKIFIYKIKTRKKFNYLISRFINLA